MEILIVIVVIVIVVLLVQIIDKRGKKTNNENAGLKPPPVQPPIAMPPPIPVPPQPQPPVQNTYVTPSPMPTPVPEPEPLIPSRDQRIKTAKKLLPKDDVEFSVEKTFSMEGKEFSLAGDFASSPGDWEPVIKRLEEMGGHYVPNVHATCRVLVIGAIERPGWKQGRFGPEITKALERVRSDGWVNLRLIYEDALL